MAKSTKPPREASLALIISLVFFILTTIGLGVFCYVLNSDQVAKDAEVAKSKKEVTDMRASLKEAELIARVHRVFTGLDRGAGDDSDLKVVQNEVKEGSKPWQEWKELNDAARRKAPELAKAIADKFNLRLEQFAKDPTAKLDVTDLIKADDFAIWSPEVDPNTKGLRAPTGNMLDVAVRARIVRDLAIKQSNADQASYANALDVMGKAAVAYQAARGQFGKAAVDLPRKFDDEMKKLQALADTRQKGYNDSMKASKEAVDGLNDSIADLTRQKNKLVEQINGLKGDVASLTGRIKEKVDPFQFDEPQGKITKRLPDRMVEIDLGSAALVQPGLTFTVLPYDYPQKGRASRLRVLQLPDERGRPKPVEVFVPKATLEVVEVLGPNLSRARLTQQDDDIRDPVMAGDLLYNSVWRKGQADHIALIGIFDTNGDGTDDIEAVVRDLTKMGVPVDAYYDMRNRKWVGRITERTRYLIEGYPVENSGTDPNRDAKTGLIKAISDAKTEATNKGVNLVSFRDFFPRTGYKARNDVPEARINQAVTRYLGGVGASDEKPPMKDGN